MRAALIFRAVNRGVLRNLRRGLPPTAVALVSLAVGFQAESHQSCASLFDRPLNSFGELAHVPEDIRTLVTASPAHRRLWEKSLEARRRWQDIERSWQPQARMEKLAAGAARAALDRHLYVRLRNLSLEDQDGIRHMRILEAIADFDPARAKWSSYRILRLVRGRYNLDQFINCR